MIYQCMFACITAALAIGGVAERSRLGPLLVFVFIYITIVYCPIGELLSFLLSSFHLF